MKFKFFTVVFLIYGHFANGSVDTFSVDVSNDLWTGPKTDRYLTNSIGFYIRTNELPDFLDSFLPDHEAEYFLTKISQDMYTPEDTSLEIPDPNDHPYAGHLYIEVRAVDIEDRVHNYTTFQFGIIGPAALGKQAQKLVHGATGSKEVRGWREQLKNELGFKVEKFIGYKTDLYELGELRFSNITFAEVGLGNVKTFAGVGTKFLAGHNPPRDDSVYDVLSQSFTSKYSLYLEADLRESLVLHNIFIDGNSSLFGHQTDLKRNKFVTKFEASLVARYGNFFLRFTQTFVDKQFKTQNGSHNYGKFSLQYRSEFNLLK